MGEYLIGQRVISGHEICVVISPPRGRRADTGTIWLRLPSGVEQWRASHNVKPLPGGQL